MLLQLLKLFVSKCMPGWLWCYEWCWVEAFVPLCCYSVSQRVSRSGEMWRRNAENRTGDRSALLLPVVVWVHMWTIGEELPLCTVGLLRVKGKLRQCLLSSTPWRHIERGGHIATHFEHLGEMVNFMLGESCPRTQWIGGWLGRTAEQDRLECKTEPPCHTHLALLIVTSQTVLSQSRTCH